MSTNKVQGQTLDYVGIYLPEDVITHGHLHVGLSRVHTAKSVAIHVNNSNGYTKNIVFKELLLHNSTSTSIEQYLLQKY